MKRNIVELVNSGIMVLPEEEDWAESCFTKDPDMLDKGWNSFKEALFETLNTENDPSPYMIEDSTEEPKTEIFSKVDTVYGSNLVKAAINRSTTGNTTFAAEQLNSDDFWSRHEMEDIFLPTTFVAEQPKSDDFWSRHKMEDIFLPTYHESSRELDPEVDLSFELEQSTEDIFKVWDLDIPDEEDGGLVKQLDKALVESSARKEMEDGLSLDDLISGFADLALSPNSG